MSLFECIYLISLDFDMKTLGTDNVSIDSFVPSGPKKNKLTEEKAKVVAAIWVAEFIQFHAALQF